MIMDRSVTQEMNRALQTDIGGAIARAPETLVEVAGVRVGVEYDGPAVVVLDAEYGAFHVTGGSGPVVGAAPFRVRLRPPPMPVLDPNRLLFDNGINWRVYDVQGGPAIAYSAHHDLAAPSEVIVFSPDAEAAEMVHADAGRPGAAIHPLERPVGPLLWRELLPRREGLLLHAAGVVVDGRAFVFLGSSGAGKSTLLRQFPHLGPIRLSDDRIVVRRIEGGPEPQWCAFGTPWPGEDGIMDPCGAPVGAMFVLDRGSVNDICAIRGAHAAAAVTAHGYLPHGSRDGIERSVALAHRLVSEVPLFRFRFVPQPGAAGFLLERAASLGH